MLHKRNCRNAIFGGAFVAMLPLGLALPPALAATPVTSQFTVQAVVNASCTITANNLNFGTYTGATLDGQTSIAVTCSASTPYSISLDQGQHYVASRGMTNGVDVLPYELYSDSSRNSAWGDTVGSTVAGIGSGAEQDLQVYGHIAPGVPVSSGTYLDTITATLTY